MNDKDASSYIADILQAIAYIEADIEGFSLEKLRADRKTRQITERNLEIISEASRHLPAAYKEREPDISWLDVANLGNILRHAYRKVKTEVLWKICKEDLSPLREAMLRMQQAGNRSP